MGVKLLASVANLGEVQAALALGADLIDLKDPSRGALGAWSLAGVRQAVGLVAGRKPVSATVGDLPMAPEGLLMAARRTAATGVDVVKIGFFAGDGQQRCARGLTAAARDGVRMVAVLMADQAPDLALLPVLRDAGFLGAMLDTAAKDKGGLRRWLGPRELERFVRRSKALGLLTGLAGSLSVADIPPLVALEPDYLGFRGALCRGGRTGALERDAFRAVRGTLDEANATLAA